MFTLCLHLPTNCCTFSSLLKLTLFYLPYFWIWTKPRHLQCSHEAEETPSWGVLSLNLKRKSQCLATNQPSPSSPAPSHKKSKQKWVKCSCTDSVYASWIFQWANYLWHVDHWCSFCNLWALSCQLSVADVGDVQPMHTNNVAGRYIRHNLVVVVHKSRTSYSTNKLTCESRFMIPSESLSCLACGRSLFAPSVTCGDSTWLKNMGLGDDSSTLVTKKIWISHH